MRERISPYVETAKRFAIRLREPVLVGTVVLVGVGIVNWTVEKTLAIEKEIVASTVLILDNSVLLSKDNDFKINIPPEVNLRYSPEIGDNVAFPGGSHGALEVERAIFSTDGKPGNVKEHSWVSFPYKGQRVYANFSVVETPKNTDRLPLKKAQNTESPDKIKVDGIIYEIKVAEFKSQK